MQIIYTRSSKLCLSVAWWSKDKIVTSVSLRSTSSATMLPHQALKRYQNVSQQFVNCLFQILKKCLQMFLGMVNFYHRFLPGLDGHLHPLHEACKGRGQAITWSDDWKIAFDTAKSALASAALLEQWMETRYYCGCFRLCCWRFPRPVLRWFLAPACLLQQEIYHSRTNALLTESSSHYILASNSFVTMLKADHSQPSLI